VSGSAAREPDLTNAQRLVEELRRELDPVEQEIRRHPYLAALEAGHVRREDLARFAGEQHHTIRSDLRSVALLVNRFGATPSGPFFQTVLGGETAALAALGAFAAAVGMDDARLQASPERSRGVPVFAPNQRVKVNLANLTIQGVQFSQNVQEALGTVLEQTSTDPSTYRIELLFSFKGVKQVEVPEERIRPT
jgi:hypothetical protein